MTSVPGHPGCRSRGPGGRLQLAQYLRGRAHRDARPADFWDVLRLQGGLSKTPTPPHGSHSVAGSPARPASGARPIPAQRNLCSVSAAASWRAGCGVRGKGPRQVRPARPRYSSTPGRARPRRPPSCGEIGPPGCPRWQPLGGRQLGRRASDPSLTATRKPLAWPGTSPSAAITDLPGHRRHLLLADGLHLLQVRGCGSRPARGPRAACTVPQAVAHANHGGRKAAGRLLRRRRGAHSLRQRDHAGNDGSHVQHLAGEARSGPARGLAAWAPLRVGRACSVSRAVASGQSQLQTSSFPSPTTDTPTPGPGAQSRVGCASGPMPGEAAGGSRARVLAVAPARSLPHLSAPGVRAPANHPAASPPPCPARPPPSSSRAACPIGSTSARRANMWRFCCP